MPGTVVCLALRKVGGLQKAMVACPDYHGCHRPSSRPFDACILLLKVLVVCQAASLFPSLSHTHPYLMMPDITAVASNPPVLVVPTRGVAVLMVLPCSCRMLVGGPRKVLITCGKQTQRMNSVEREAVAGTSRPCKEAAIPAQREIMPHLLPAQ